MMYRTGFGYDAHRLVKSRSLFLGGIKIQSEFGSLAHSDGDVLLHAIIDSMFGALALGDIGTHFPDSDNRYKNISSLILLEKTYEIVLSKGYRTGNIDSTICLQSPKIKPYIIDIQNSIAKTLNLSSDKISVKSTTTEKMGFVGRGEGIAAYAVVTLIKDDTEVKFV